MFTVKEQNTYDMHVLTQANELCEISSNTNAMASMHMHENIAYVYTRF